MKVAFLGVGAMGGALSRGVISAGFLPAEDIIAYDPDPARLRELGASTGCRTALAAAEAVKQADAMVICVKPAVIGALLDEIAPAVRPEQLVISIAAGVRVASIESALPKGVPVVRVMPNTPAMVGEGMAAIAPSHQVSAQQRDFALGLMQSVGEAVVVDEKLMDAVTGLSGSGPAFVYIIIEALSDAGVSVGLPRDISTKLAAQTVLGSAKMVMQTGRHTGQLKDQVTSPGGTTIAGCAELERGGLRAALYNAVQAATRKSAELGK